MQAAKRRNRDLTAIGKSSNTMVSIDHHGNPWENEKAERLPLWFVRVCRAIRTRSFASAAYRGSFPRRPASLPCRCALADEALGDETGSGNRLLLHRFCISPRVFWTALRYVALPCPWCCETKSKFRCRIDWSHSLASSYPEVSYGKSLITHHDSINLVRLNFKILLCNDRCSFRARK